MTQVTPPTDIQIQQGMCAIVLPLTRTTDGSHIVPQSTLAADTVAGTSTSITLTASNPQTAGFGIGSLVMFNDTLGEDQQFVAEGTGGTPWDGQSNPLPIDFTNRGYSALQYHHTAGTTVYTNLVATTPWDIASGLLQGDAVIFTRVLSAHWQKTAMPRGFRGRWEVELQYHRLLNRPGQENLVRINPNAWADRQETLARGDMDIINTAILSNPTLGGLVHQMGTLGSRDSETQITWASETTAADTTHLYARLRAVYSGVWGIQQT